MMTVDRVPRPNYLRTTLDNLERAGVFSTPLLHSFNLFNSYADSQRYIYEAIGSRPITVWHPQVGRRRATENAAEALRLGGKYREADWVLFLEDDIDVIKNFLESLQDWLERHKNKSLIFPLGANYEELVYLARLGVVEASGLSPCAFLWHPRARHAASGSHGGVDLLRYEPPRSNLRSAAR